jgi:hypothetical protein
MSGYRFIREFTNRVDALALTSRCAPLVLMWRQHQDRYEVSQNNPTSLENTTQAHLPSFRNSLLTHPILLLGFCNEHNLLRTIFGMAPMV